MIYLLIDYFRLYECSLSSEVYIEGNNHDHTDLKDDIVEIKEAHGINEYFKEIINQIVRENPHIKPMEIHK